jgi:adenosyl cobinamide kinase/adenosyl cobinamide phosphate guanylyltransferase
MGRLILITGGARSGKSRLAEEIADRAGGDEVTYIATCQPADEEMVERVAKHRAARPAAWRTIEEPLRLADAVRRCDTGAALIDCLTLYVTNVLFSEDEDQERAERVVNDELLRLVDAVAETGKIVIVVTNEVGMGIVPATPLGRAFRDIAGRAGQELARHADEAYMAVLGIPIKLK